MIASPNYTQIPNEILDNLMNILSGAELKVLLKICRNTFGWRKEKDKISISQIEKSTGLSRPKIIQAIKKLEKENIIIVTRCKGAVSQFEIKVDELVNSVNQTSKLSLPVEPETSKLSLPTKESNINKNINKDIEIVYAQYPSRCPISKRSTGKTSKNKHKIKTILNNGHNIKSLTNLVGLYLSDCKASKTYIKNFSTFLNNLPDENDFKDPEQSMTAYERRQMREWEKEDAKKTLKTVGVI